MGRPATGRTTKTLGVRLSLDKVEELERRAAKMGLAPTAWAAQVLERELAREPGYQSSQGS